MMVGSGTCVRGSQVFCLGGVMNTYRYIIGVGGFMHVLRAKLVTLLLLDGTVLCRTAIDGGVCRVHCTVPLWESYLLAQV